MHKFPHFDWLRALIPTVQKVEIECKKIKFGVQNLEMKDD